MLEDRLNDVARRFEELHAQMVDPGVVGNQALYKTVSKEYKLTEKIMVARAEYLAVTRRIAEDEAVLQDNSDNDLKEMVQAELPELVQKRAALDEHLKRLLIPRDPDDSKDTMVEIRAGTGGDEAALFAADVFRMYTKFAERSGWKVEVMSFSPTGIGGFKEIIFMVTGDEVFGRLKFESGIHRVQRVPKTEAQGRIHTSAITVAILPEAEEVELNVPPQDLRFDVFRSSGPGGQSVNTTDSAVRVTHIPSGLVVSCQDEKSQHKNRAKGLRILMARLLEKKRTEQHDQIAQERKLQIGSGDRSEKIRTYNFPQNRLTDHRINYTVYNLDQVMEGDLSELLEVLAVDNQKRLLEGKGQL
jgi:peptide chain release factor 1